MKQMWNLTSSDTSLVPTLKIASSVNVTTKQTKVVVDINGVLNNQKLSTDNSSTMVASAAW